MNRTNQYFFAFFTWWCVWNSLLIILHSSLRLIYREKRENFSSQLFSFVILLSNILIFFFYGFGILVWLASCIFSLFSNVCTKKLIPIPDHSGRSNAEVFKVIYWWLYSPCWHFFSPFIFVNWFRKNQNINIILKRKKKTVFLSFIHPVLFYLYCYSRKKIVKSFFGNRFVKRPFFSWPMFFLSPKRMSRVFGIRDKSWWNIILLAFWIPFFSALSIFSLRKLANEKNMNKIEENKQKYEQA